MNHRSKSMFLGLAATAALLAGPLASADDHPYTEGHVVNVSAVRTEYGRTEEYLKFLAGNWKKEMEASKAAGLILDYHVYAAEPRGPNDPDFYLVVTYKNWAALDGLADKSDAIASKVYGSVMKSDEGAVDRSKIRHILGSETIQELVLK